MDKPFFSIILPTYNRADFIVGAINSVIDQRFLYWELIIVDDGSTDNTKQIVESFTTTDSRIKYFYQNNLERSLARNKGIDISQCEYLCFLDSDDTYEEDFLFELSKTIETQNIDIVLSNIKFNGRTSLTNHTNIEKSFTIDYFFSRSTVPGQCCIRKSFLGDVRFNPKFRISEDTIFLCDLVSKNPRIYFCPKAFLLYSEHDSNSVNYKKFNAYKERYEALNYILTKSYSKKINKEVKRRTLSDCYFGIFKYHYYQKQVSKARFNIFIAIFLFPKIQLKQKLYLLLYAHKKNLFT